MWKSFLKWQIEKCKVHAPGWQNGRGFSERKLGVYWEMRCPRFIFNWSTEICVPNSGGLSNIFTPSHFFYPHILTSSHLLIFTSKHLHTFSSLPPHIFTSSHLLIFTFSHLHILTSSHLLIFTSSHLHIFSSSHLLIFTPSHLLIFTSSHLHIFTFSLALFIFSSSHLLIFTSHLHIFSSPRLSCPLALLPSCSLALLLSPSFLFLSWRRGAVPTRRHETQPFRTKWGSIAKKLR